MEDIKHDIPVGGQSCAPLELRELVNGADSSRSRPTNRAKEWIDKQIKIVDAEVDMNIKVIKYSVVWAPCQLMGQWDRESLGHSWLLLKG